MTDKSLPVEPETIACDVCLKDIPKNVGQSMEGGDYIHHFCGLECYNKWQETEATDKSKAVNE